MASFHQKIFKLSDKELERFDRLKVKTKKNTDIDLFREMLNCVEIIQSKQLVPADLLVEKDEKLNKLFFEFGRLQGILKEKEEIINNLKQDIDEVKNKSLFKRIFWAMSLKK